MAIMPERLPRDPAPHHGNGGLGAAVVGGIVSGIISGIIGACN